ncbi:MAG TPA: pyruvate formate lyase family protein [Deltaproteobacteria bacterium]|nr:pyruvate formate lyase family protein [Deltaproteobacteria bacterium]HPR54205.1 pyruvate formate lyase family protein [Deltaproteobacteria bacterium]HXK45884.1 pyruvate formate lyase family protein [Deltaproteobacteria bacterium]
MSMAEALRVTKKIKEPKNLSPRIAWLRDYYLAGAGRSWNNEFTAWTTGTDWDVIFDEMTFYIVPETYPFLQTFGSSIRQAARPVGLHPEFWTWSLPERKAWFVKEVMVNYVPQEILPGDLIAGTRFNVQTSLCWTRKEARERNRLVLGPKGVRSAMKWFHDHGYGNSGATSGHLIPGYERALKIGWKGIHGELERHYEALGSKEKKGKKGAQLRAMMIAATMPRDLAARYSALCERMAAQEKAFVRRAELKQMAENLKRVPWEPASTFWEAVQALWLTHMLIMSDENYPGPGVSFGRIDQYLMPYWRRSMDDGMDREFGKEILKCFWVHANTAYDAMVRIGNNGITAGYGQLITLSGVGPGGADMTNELTYTLLEVIDEMSPILEPKPNVRLHRNSPDELLDKVVDMVSTSQGAPFLINFDERSMAGMMVEAAKAGVTHLINNDTVYDYAPVGCLENTMQGNDRSGTVDNNLNLLKAVELALNDGKDFFDFVDPITARVEKVKQTGPSTGDPRTFAVWDVFWKTYAEQTRYIVKSCATLYEKSESVRARFCPTPYLSCLVKGCAEKGLDITQGGAELSFTTLEAVTFATTVDSLLAVKYLVFDRKECTMDELLRALKANWEGFGVLQAKARFKAPKYGRDDDEADAMASAVMDLWCSETWRYRTVSTNRQFRPGMLSWNYWVSDGYILPASPDGRPKGRFLSNAICPSNGADINGPTANTNSVGKALGGLSQDDTGDYLGYRNCLPNGASHTISINPSLLRDPEHRDKFKAFLRGYAVNGGTCLQLNMIDADTLKEAQRHPEDYRSLLVRITGYNAYFTSVGRELQNELIARISHEAL